MELQGIKGLRGALKTHGIPVSLNSTAEEQKKRKFFCGTVQYSPHKLPRINQTGRQSEIKETAVP
jgi:hypothetical protein